MVVMAIWPPDVKRPSLTTSRRYNPTQELVKPLKLRACDNKLQLQDVTENVAPQIESSGPY
jgi:hypothetical protein